MFRFPEPSPRIKFSAISSKDLHQAEKLLESFPIHSVHFLIPSLNTHKEKYKETLLSDDCTYFVAEDVAASCLIQQPFLDNFVKSGLLFAVTNYARVETENIMAIVPLGKLILYLEKNITQTLALHKEKSSIKKRNKKRRLSESDFETIIVDLMCTELYPGKKHYQFISSELSKIDYLKFSLLLRWKPNGDICPQSLKNYFTSQDLKCIAYKPKHKEFLKHSVPVPNINFEMKDPEILNDILEWVGMQICSLDYATDEEDYINKLTVPEFFEKRILNRSSFEGLYTKSDILPIIEESSKVFENDTSLPFIAVCISGFQDAFVQANGFQFFSSDDKIICIIIFPSSNYFLITLNCR